MQCGSHRARGTFRSPFQRIFIIINSLVIPWKTLLVKLFYLLCFVFLKTDLKLTKCAYCLCHLLKTIREKCWTFQLSDMVENSWANNKVTKKFIRTSWKMTCSQEALKSSNIVLRIWKATYKGKALSMSKLGIFRKAWKDPKLSPLANH